MRMKLYEVGIQRGSRSEQCHIVAPDPTRVGELVNEYDDAFEYNRTDPTWKRIDQSLSEDRKQGLDAVLENAPVGFASYERHIGWTMHVKALFKLRFFTIKDIQNKVIFIIAPDADMAKSIYAANVSLNRGPTLIFQIWDGVRQLRKGEVRNLPDLLKFGPIGIAEYDHDQGWVVI